MRPAHISSRSGLTAAATIATAVLVGCGSDAQSETTSSVTRTTTTNETTASARSAGKPRGPGRLLGGPLVYRDVPDYLPRYGYVVFFRTQAAFSRANEGGASTPGEIELADSFDNHDGFAGAISSGRPSGKCYWWALRSTPKLSGVKLGQRTTLRLKLTGTTTQNRTVTIRQPSSGLTTATWTTTGRVARDLRRIGCTGTSYGGAG